MNEPLIEILRSKYLNSDEFRNNQSILASNNVLLKLKTLWKITN